MALDQPAQALPETRLEGGIPLPRGVGEGRPDRNRAAPEAGEPGQGQGIATIVPRSGQHVDRLPFRDQGQGPQRRMLLQHQGGDAPGLDGPVFRGPHLIGGEQGDHGHSLGSFREIRLQGPGVEFHLRGIDPALELLGRVVRRHGHPELGQDAAMVVLAIHEVHRGA